MGVTTLRGIMGHNPHTPNLVPRAFPFKISKGNVLRSSLCPGVDSRVHCFNFKKVNVLIFCSLQAAVLPSAEFIF